MNTHESQGSGKVRLDKWLWAARFYKTRSLSAEEIDKGRVRVNGAAAKPAREVRIGDCIEMRTGSVVRTVHVLALSGVRGPATAAALLFAETADSVALRIAAGERRRLAPEPGEFIAQGRPSKRNRRDLDALRRPAVDWNQRWSAAIDDTN
ncbi:MAG: RNA-binding S4 domain-containing protein [Hydrogenophaga sp.]